MNVDIYSGALGRSYEFELDEELTIDSLIEEIAAAICQREHCTPEGDLSGLVLFHDRKKKLLSRYQTVVQAEIVNGDKLTLI